VIDVWQDPLMTFHERLRGSMQRKGWDQKALAREAGLSESAVSRHLERDEAPRADSLAKYAEVLGVTVSWLGWGRPEAVAAAPTAAAPGERRDVVGLEALGLVLRDYAWPADVDMVTIDAAESAAREAAATPAGQMRSPSAWRAFLDRMVRRASEPRSRSSRRIG